jgi:O-Antigen ligase
VIAGATTITERPGERPRAWRATGGVLLCGVTAATAATLLATGNPLYAMLPVLISIAAYAVLTLPLRWTFFAFLSLVIVADVAPRDLAGLSVWQSPVYPLQLLLLDNLDKATGIAALRFSGAEVVLVLMALLAVSRTVSGRTVDRVSRIPGASPLAAALALTLVTVVIWEAWGIARGGDVRQSLWQFRQLLWLPVLTALLTYALRGPRDFGALVWVITGTACVKVAIGLYYYLAIARPANVKPPTVTSHSDSVLFVAVTVVWVALAVYRPTPARLAVGAGVGAWMLLGMIINNRRTAFVGLIAAFAVLFVMLPNRTRRRIGLVALCCLPLLAAYLFAGRHRTTGIFVPAASILSVTEQTDASSATRDIENYNLLVTLKQHMILGSGWGHEYVEVSKAYDISHAFEQYRYIAHNSVLWLWSLLGLIGFTGLWLPHGVATFLAARAHRHARTGDERAAAFAVIAVIVTFAIQAWADMGTQAWTCVLLLACAFAASAKLATATNAWPPEIRLLRVSRLGSRSPLRASGARAK